MIISTRLINEALIFYQSKGFRMIDVPFVVDEKISNYTKPSERNNIHHSRTKVYVASAEQSFLQMFYEGSLCMGKYMALTTCCRDEESLDNTHYKTFLKLELISVGEKDVNSTLLPATQFFNRFVETSTVEEEGITDIMCKDIELGSYGRRQFYNSDVSYVFGTGIAEPRLSLAISL